MILYWSFYFQNNLAGGGVLTITPNPTQLENFGKYCKSLFGTKREKILFEKAVFPIASENFRNLPF